MNKIKKAIYTFFFERLDKLLHGSDTHENQQAEICRLKTDNEKLNEVIEAYENRYDEVAILQNENQYYKETNWHLEQDSIDLVKSALRYITEKMITNDNPHDLAHLLDMFYVPRDDISEGIGSDINIYANANITADEYRNKDFIRRIINSITFDTHYYGNDDYHHEMGVCRNPARYPHDDVYEVNAVTKMTYLFNSFALEKSNSHKSELSAGHEQEEQKNIDDVTDYDIVVGHSYLIDDDIDNADDDEFEP